MNMQIELNQYKSSEHEEKFESVPMNINILNRSANIQYMADISKMPDVVNLHIFTGGFHGKVSVITIIIIVDSYIVYQTKYKQKWAENMRRQTIRRVARGGGTSRNVPPVRSKNFLFAVI